MTAVANPPNLPQLSRSTWGMINGNDSTNADEGRGMFVPRKNLPRSNSSSSISSDSSATSVATNGSQSNGTSLSTTSDSSQWSANGPQRKRLPPKNPWPAGKTEPQSDFARFANARQNGMLASQGNIQQGQGSLQSQMGQQGMLRPVGSDQLPHGQPVLYLLSMNGTFERKTIAVPFAPESLRIGRQTNQKTLPTPGNGFFDSKVLSRQHAEVFAERNGKIFIRDVKSSNGTFVNGTRLSQENRESEPHELQTADHLELGIDIVSEDQKTVVHHKVAAKVEHAGFMAASSNVLDMNFGELDPANGGIAMPTGPMQMRGRTMSNNSINSNGRMVQNAPPPQQAQGSGLVQQRPFFMAPIATDQIMKRLTAEMRNARLQAQDLGRTNEFVSTLLSKDDLKDLEKQEAAEAQKAAQPMTNGNGVLRTDTKPRFSDPPAPPPQQPLPEKPDVSAAKRGERPKSGPPNASPIRQDNLGQIIQLTEALNNAKRDIDMQTARMRELEAMLEKEKEAREAAEGVARRLEESAALQMNGTANADVEKIVPEPEKKDVQPDNAKTLSHATTTSKEIDAGSQTRLDDMAIEVIDLKDQLVQWQKRCEIAEMERDRDRTSLEEMVIHLREEEMRRQAAQKESESASRPKATVIQGEESADDEFAPAAATRSIGKLDVGEVSSSDGLEGSPTLSRANTIKPISSHRGNTLQDQRLQASLPYASMMGVVLIGMGMMAYINGWQSRPPSVDR